MRTRVFLSPSQPQLIGKYPEDAEHIHVICNGTRAFTTGLPDLNACEQMEFVFYNTGTANVTVTGKLFSDGTKTHTIIPGASVSFVSNMKTMWLIG
jgi:hypothetical protein